jgi:hypothetical protein
MKTAILTILSLAMLPLASSVEPPTVGFDVLASFDYEEGMKLPEEVTKHHEKKVTVTGFMATEDGSEGDVEYFIIINDACGCEGTPKLNEMVFCAMPEGETVKIKPGTAEVTGTLFVEEVKEDDVVVALYSMDVESVK